MYEWEQVFPQVEDHSDSHGVPAKLINITHVDHFDIFSVFFPKLDIFLIVQKVSVMFYFFYQDRMSVRYVLAGIQNWFILLAQLFYVRIFLLCQGFDLLLTDNGHRQGNRVVVQNGNLNDQFVSQLYEQTIEKK